MELKLLYSKTRTDKMDERSTRSPLHLTRVFVCTSWYFVGGNHRRRAE